MNDTLTIFLLCWQHQSSQIPCIIYDIHDGTDSATYLLNPDSSVLLGVELGRFDFVFYFKYSEALDEAERRQAARNAGGRYFVLPVVLEY